MVRRQRAATYAATTLDGGIDSSVTSLDVASASGFPTSGDFYIAVGAEIMLVTAVATNTFTVIRGQCGTAAAAWSNGQQVNSIITAEEFTNRAKDRGQIKTLPYGVIQVDDGTILTSADFTVQNVSTGSAVGDSQDGVIYLTSRLHSGNDTTGATRSFSSTDGNLRIIAHLDCPAFNRTNGDMLSFYQRQNTGGSMSGISLYPNLKLAFQTRASFISASVDVTTHGAMGRRDFWAMLTIEWDYSASTDRLTWYYSWDGVHWFQIGQETFASTALSPGIWMTNQTLVTQRANLISWYEGAL